MRRSVEAGMEFHETLVAQPSPVTTGSEDELQIDVVDRDDVHVPQS